MCALGFGGSVEQSAGVTTVVMHGEADLAARAEFEGLIEQALATDAARIVVDLADLRYLESACLRALLHARASAEGNDRMLVVRGATGIVRRVLEVSGVAEILIEEDGTSDAS
jgi:anti-sigma B factor antagonist